VPEAPGVIVGGEVVVERTSDKVGARLQKVPTT